MNGIPITPNTPLYLVRRFVWEVFGVAIDNSDARDVRHAIASGAYTMTADSIVMPSSTGPVRISRRGVQWDCGDILSRHHQNAIMRRAGWLCIDDAELHAMRRAEECAARFWEQYEGSNVSQETLRHKMENECGDKIARPRATLAIPKRRTTT